MLGYVQVRFVGDALPTQGPAAHGVAIVAGVVAAQRKYQLVLKWVSVQLFRAAARLELSRCIRQP